MTRNPLPFLFLATSLAACQVPTSPTEAEAISLWQGGDPLAEGWAMAGPGRFTVVDGTLQTEGGMGLMWYQAQDFADFRLELEFMVEEQGDNAGVFLRFPPTDGDPWVAVHQGYEVQICEQGKNIHQTGSIYDFQGPTAIPTKPAGEWNSYRITVRGQRYTVDLNGIRVNDFMGSRGLRGHIGLQNHDADSVVRFRNLRVTPL